MSTSEPTPSVSLGNYTWNEVDIKNTPGSTAGSGSGDFHQYRMQRRKEMFRVAIMDKQAKEQEVHAKYQEHREQIKEAEEAKTAKKSQKRKNKKEKQRHNKIRKKWEAALEHTNEDEQDSTTKHDTTEKKVEENDV